MTILGWRHAEFRSAADKKALQHFRCTDEEARTELSAVGSGTAHSRIWELHAQELVQQEVRDMRRARFIVRLGFDDEGLGAVVAAEEIDPGDLYFLHVGAVASRLRRQHNGALGDELLTDVFDQIASRCAEVGTAGDTKVAALVHRNNFASKRMCERNGMRFDGSDEGEADYEDWSRMLPVPQPKLFR